MLTPALHTPSNPKITTQTFSDSETRNHLHFSCLQSGDVSFLELLHLQLYKIGREKITRVCLDKLKPAMLNHNHVNINLNIAVNRYSNGALQSVKF